MATQLQLRRGTTSQVAAFTGANGEVVVDTEKKTLFVNDGSTAGGLEIARADFSNISASASLTVGTLTATTLNVTTLDLTTLEVTNIKAKDGTSAGSIADSTGVVTIASAVLTTADINAGTVDVSTVTAPTITASTSLKTPLIEYTDGDDAITIADGGGVTIADLTATTADINGGTFDGVVGGTTPGAGSFTTLSASTSITGTLATAAQTNITSVGTLTGFTSTGIDDNASSTAITIDSGQRVGIATTSPGSFNSAGNDLVVGAGDSGDNNGITIYTNANSTGHLLFADGTSGTAGYTGYIGYTHSSDYMSFHTNGGSEAMRIDSDGNLGVGVVPAARLHAYSTSAETLRLEGNDEYTYLSFKGTVSSSATFLGLIGYANQSGTAADLNIENTQNGAMTFATNDTIRLRINNAGNLGLGVVPKSYGSGYHAIDMGSHSAIMAGESGSSFYLLENSYWDGSNFKAKNTASGSQYQQADGTHRWKTMASVSAGSNQTVQERARINATGQFIVGRTTDDVDTIGAMIDSNGIVYSSINETTFNTFLFRAAQSANAYRFYVGGNGQVNAVFDSIAQISDARLKENVRDYTVGLDDILKLKPRVFDWKEHQGKDKKNDVGFIAQEFEEVFPDWIGTFLHDDVEDAKSVSTGSLIFPMVNAIKELSTEIESLKAEIAALKGA